MTSHQPLDADSITLISFFLEHQKKIPNATGELTQLLTSIQTAAKTISSAVRRAGIIKL